MKAVIVHTDFRIYWPNRLSALTEYLRTINISLEIIEIAGLGSPYDFADKTVRYPENWLCLFPDKKIEDIAPSQAKSEVVKTLNKLNPEMVISGPIAFPSGAASVYWAVKNKKKIIIFDDARYSDVPRPWWIDWIKTKVYQCIDAIFCPSQDWFETYKRFGFSEGQLFYGIDVVDNEFWKMFETQNSLLKGTKCILSVGRFVPKKNFITLLRAYKKYAESTSDPYKMILIGQGPEEAELKSYASENKLSEKICFYPLLNQEELRSFYHKALWFILPSKIGETWGLVVNEAMASGLPILVSNQAGCAPVLIKNGLNGFYFSPDDENELANWLIRISLIPENEREAMGKKSLEIISEWGIDRFCKGLSDAINFVFNFNRKTPDILSRLIIQLWNGRYKLR